MELMESEVNNGVVIHYHLPSAELCNTHCKVVSPDKVSDAIAEMVAYSLKELARE